jgi:hypothetical protein
MPSFEIIKNPKPNLPKVKMQCDESIDKKLENIPAIKQCFSRSNVSLISGGMGAGKSTFVLQMMRGVFKGCFETIYLFMPEQSFESMSEQDKRFLRKNLVDEEGESTIYHEFNEDVLSELYSKLEDSSAEKYNSLVIIDDYGAEFKQKRIELILNRICLKNRHLRTSIWFLTQNYYMMPKKMREICNNIVMFNTNKSQNQKLFQEQFDLKDEQFRELMHLLPTRHDYLLLNLNYKKIYHNWDEIRFPE